MATNVNTNPVTKETKKIVEKITLVSPYLDTWPHMNINAATVILDAVTGILKSLSLAKPLKNQLKLESGVVKSLKKASKRKLLKAMWAKREPHRRHLVLGMSNSLRSLEKDELCAFLICRDLTPSLMTQPFASLCSTRSVAGAAISQLGKALQEVLNFKSCKALGLKRSVAEDEQNVFHELYKVICKNAPKLDCIQRDIERTIEERKSMVEDSTVGLEKVTRPPEKDYSYLYIKKDDIKAISAKSADSKTKAKAAGAKLVAAKALQSEFQFDFLLIQISSDSDEEIDPPSKCFKSEEKHLEAKDNETKAVEAKTIQSVSECALSLQVNSDSDEEIDPPSKHFKSEEKHIEAKVAETKAVEVESRCAKKRARAKAKAKLDKAKDIETKATEATDVRAKSVEVKAPQHVSECDFLSFEVKAVSDKGVDDSSKRFKSEENKEFMGISHNIRYENMKIKRFPPSNRKK